MSVALVVVSHSAKIADGAVEVAREMAPDVIMMAAGGTDDGRIGTSLDTVMAALEKASCPDGVVILADLGSAIMTAESALEFLPDPDSAVLADAPLVEGLVAAAVAAQGGADRKTVLQAAEELFRRRQPDAEALGSMVAEGPPTGSSPDFSGDFTLVNEAGLHARPAAQIAGGLAAMDAEVTINAAEGGSMTSLMILAAGKGTVLHVEAWGVDAERAVKFVGGLVEAGFGEA
ncbi:dihydroxyacetone kinase phosphoryl donor subunit DhaM [Pseudarthrobacter sp. PS3-L1]|uniref:dihydroxyacetone kinase phosphoryl donor subunit DhaM n=1 Tax=Pseudarthrobacter sp. PS3-L1 TaxID=3046207 RepID=UPI0024BB557E|nr:dihydroxyacetone kinase phosphoryl donor subunit DhaM [Pseudarthrobacter sp. PS3-L1]MDJ0320770.1 dihydroxyacetone kinase phosphoryl donor subunit DhaM [Pseudarthrobacter sp. PS3-L1]